MHLTAKKPQIIEAVPQIVYHSLKAYRFFNKSVFLHAPEGWLQPIAIGNYTDMCMTPTNRAYLVRLLREHKRLVPEIPVCILTKAILDRPFLEEISRLSIKIIFFISLSFLSPQFEKGTPSIKSRLENFRLLSEFPNIKFVHWWRPVTSLNAPNRETIEHQIDSLLQAGAKLSVVTGLAHGEQLRTFLKNPLNPFSKYLTSHLDPSSDLIFEPRIRKEILDAATRQSYTVFTSTACAVSYVLEQPCYNAGFRKLFRRRGCLSSNCSAVHKERCAKIAHDYPVPSLELLGEVASYLNRLASDVEYSSEHDAILIKGTLHQEEQNFLTQATSFPVLGEDLRKNLEWTADRQL